MAQLRWSRVCLVANLTMFVLSGILAGVFIGLVCTRFQDIPESNVWVESLCTITDFKVLRNAGGSHEGTYPYFSANTSHDQLDLCVVTNLNRKLSSQQAQSRINTFMGQTMDCYIPPNPDLFEQCYEETPIGNLVLLQAGEDQMHEILETHHAFYALAWTSGVMAVFCLMWMCYSYWFYLCGCNESRYWCCGRNPKGYQSLINELNIGFVEPDHPDHPDTDTNVGNSAYGSFFATEDTNASNNLLGGNVLLDDEYGDDDDHDDLVIHPIGQTDLAPDIEAQINNYISGTSNNHVADPA